jgi:phenylpropionate dioxygenase-like ring-hydroxylating dioxygenase large terminal subunit
MDTATELADDPTVIQRVLDHIDNRSTDLAATGWREPIENYRSPERFAAELDVVLRRQPVGFCPSAALAEAGAFVAREAAGTPVIAVRGRDGAVRAFLNACSHRGAQVACQSTGCAKAFVCPYHGWVYGLDGGLRGIPHDDGFPDLDRTASGLTPLTAIERGGVVFVAQQPATPAMTAELDQLPRLIPHRFRFVKVDQLDVAANWKIAVEGFLEGYHIRSTHPDTFYPIQYDNLNVIESFGRHNRVTFPYRNIEALRTVDPSARSADGCLTYAYHLFPNVIVATQPGRMSLIVLEPLTVASTRFVIYALSDHHDGSQEADAAFEGEESFAAKGAAQDRAIIRSIQRSLAANPREFFEFGLFEGAIGHFHRELAAAIDGRADASDAGDAADA